MELFKALKTRSKSYDVPFKHWEIYNCLDELTLSEFMSSDKQIETAVSGIFRSYLRTHEHRITPERISPDPATANSGPPEEQR